MSPAEAGGDDAPDILPFRGPERQVARAAAVVGTATLASRILGFLRDLVLAQAFGAGPITDAFFVAFRLPNLLRRLLAEGALSSAFIPVFTEYVATRTRTDLVRMFRAVSGVALATLAVVSVAGMIGAPLVVRLMAPGFFGDPRTGALTIHLTRLMFPYLLFVGLSALAMGMLNAHRHFLAPAVSPIALNVAIIGAVLVVVPRVDPPVVGLAIGVLFGGLGQLAMQVPPLAGRGLLVLPSLEAGHPAVRRIGRLMAPVVLSQSASQLNVLVNTVIASFLAGGSVSYLYYADRLVEFPLGVFGIAIATAVLPTLAEQAARNDRDALGNTLSFALRLAAFISTPAAIGLLLLRESIVRVLYQRGEFGPVETAGTAVALAFYALALTGWTTAKIATQAFYALGDTRTPVRIAIASMALNSVLAFGLAFPLAHAGLALAAAGSASVQAGALVWRLRRRLGRSPGRRARLAWLRIAAVSAALALALALAGVIWPPPPGRLAEALWLGTMIAASVLLYGGAHLALGSDEVWLLCGALARRRRKSSLP